MVDLKADKTNNRPKIVKMAILAEFDNFWAFPSNLGSKKYLNRYLRLKRHILYMKKFRKEIPPLRQNLTTISVHFEPNSIGIC